MEICYDADFQVGTTTSFTYSVPPSGLEELHAMHVLLCVPAHDCKNRVKGLVAEQRAVVVHKNINVRPCEFLQYYCCKKTKQFFAVTEVMSNRARCNTVQVKMTPTQMNYGVTS